MMSWRHSIRGLRAICRSFYPGKASFVTGDPAEWICSVLGRRIFFQATESRARARASVWGVDAGITGCTSF